MLGRLMRASPQFMSMSEGSWLGTSATMERTTQRSSAQEPMWGKRSEISRPDWPYFLKANGEGKAAPVLRSVLMYSMGSGLPAYFAREGLGSKESTWERPPLRKK